ncbi:hypothetical protein EYF80_056052 [Liparis tanakae]|uniref:Uncharacterized protein n=1 Tax=Liparis tanakae TaxID=230148 RepID=A0A4Z2EY43_9TELE|nr:hypothetical protein EYF80_056052 [Liparis tanakae]
MAVKAANEQSAVPGVNVLVHPEGHMYGSSMSRVAQSGLVNKFSLATLQTRDQQETRLAARLRVLLDGRRETFTAARVPANGVT